MKNIYTSLNCYPPAVMSIISDAISQGYDHSFALTRRGFLAGEIFHKTIELCKEFEVVEQTKVFNVQLFATPILKGFFVQERQLPTF